MIEKRDLIELNREFDYSDRFQLNTDGIDLSNILDKYGMVNISDMDFNNDLLENFSNEINKILNPLSIPDLISKSISIIAYK